MFEVRRALYDQIAGANKAVLVSLPHTHTMAAGLLLFHSEKSPRSLTVYFYNNWRACIRSRKKRQKYVVGNLCKENKRTCLFLFREIEQFFIFFSDWIEQRQWFDNQTCSF
jgi:hypothetical protein